MVLTQWETLCGLFFAFFEKIVVPILTSGGPASFIMPLQIGKTPIVALNEQQSRALFSLAAKKGCVLMDALKTAYATAYSRLLLLAKEGKIGEVYSVDWSVRTWTGTMAAETFMSIS